MKTVFRVHKLDCSSCAMVIEGICEDVAGVEKAEVKTRERILVVEHGDAVDLVQLQEALTSEGYPVQREEQTSSV